MVGMGYENEIVKVKNQYTLVTLTKAKAHLNVDPDFKLDDQLILDKVEDAISIVEGDTGREIIPTKNIIEFIEFSNHCWTINESPFLEILSLKGTIDDVEGELVDGEDFKIKKNNSYFEIIFEGIKTFDKLTVEFKTGYSSDSLPRELRAAVLVKVADLYDIERTSTTSGLNFRDIRTYDRLIGNYIVYRK